MFVCIFRKNRRAIWFRPRNRLGGFSVHLHKISGFFITHRKRGNLFTLYVSGPTPDRDVGLKYYYPPRSFHIIRDFISFVLRVNVNKSENRISAVRAGASTPKLDNGIVFFFWCYTKNRNEQLFFSAAGRSWNARVEIMGKVIIWLLRGSLKFNLWVISSLSMDAYVDLKKTWKWVKKWDQ